MHAGIATPDSLVQAWQERCLLLLLTRVPSTEVGVG
jgi:hypothetical protein